MKLVTEEASEETTLEVDFFSASKRATWMSSTGWMVRLRIVRLAILKELGRTE